MFDLNSFKYWETLVRIEGKIDALTQLLARGITAMSKELDDLTAQVAANTTIEKSAITLIQGIAAKLAAAGTDPVKLSALTAELNGSASDLAAAVAANTPAATP